MRIIVFFLHLNNIGAERRLTALGNKPEPADQNEYKHKAVWFWLSRVTTILIKAWREKKNVDCIAALPHNQPQF